MQHKFYVSYDIYSQCYKKDKNKVINKNGKNICILYEFISSNMLIFIRIVIKNYGKLSIIKKMIINKLGRWTNKFIIRLLSSH